MSVVYPEIVYRINDLDELTFLSPGWDEFASANDGPEVAAENVLGRRLWEFISDETTLSLYREMVDQAHAGRHLEFRFRCDSPTSRRQMQMHIAKGSDGEIQFTSTTHHEDERPNVGLLDATLPRIGGMLKICGWCKRLDIGAGLWSEIEEAANAFSLFERSSLPPLSHGMCEECFERVSAGMPGRRN